MKRFTWKDFKEAVEDQGVDDYTLLDEIRWEAFRQELPEVKTSAVRIL